MLRVVPMPHDTSIGKTSITVDVEVFAQRNPKDQVTVRVTEAGLTCVAVGADRRPREIGLP